MSEREPGLADYLNRSDDQRRLLGLMANGHGRAKHGRELGEPNAAAYRARVGRHLRRAPIGLEVLDSNGDPRYLIADARANQVAWITRIVSSAPPSFSPARECTRTCARWGQGPRARAPSIWPRSAAPPATRCRPLCDGSHQRRAVQRSTAARVP